MDIHLKRSKILSGKTIVISGSKSESNRLLILQKLFPELKIDNLSDSDDVQAMQKGVSTVSNYIDVHHAGTTMRFLTAYYALCSSGEWQITGSDRMKERPIGVLVDALRQLGADINYSEQVGFPPLKIKGIVCEGGVVELQADVSSQYITALLLIGTSFEKGLTINLVGNITSRPYIEMTLQLLNQLGCNTCFVGNKIEVLPLKKLNKVGFVVESDWSSASYFYGIIALGAIGDEVKLAYFKPESLQGDANVASLYSKLGVETVYNKDETITLRKVEEVQTIFEADLIKTPDLAQTIAVTCFGLGIACTLKGLHTLKIKETDRLLALKNELTKLGAKISITTDSLHIEESTFIETGCKINTYQDHRMAMSFAMLATRTDICIHEGEVVSKSFVNFWSNLEGLGIVFDTKNE